MGMGTGTGRGRAMSWTPATSPSDKAVLERSRGGGGQVPPMAQGWSCPGACRHGSW